MGTRPISAELDQEVAQDAEMALLVQQAMNEELGKSLRQARTWAGFSQGQVARAMGVSRSRVAQIESAEGTSISLGVLLRYVRAVGCRLDIDLVDPATDEKVVSIYAFDGAPSETDTYEFHMQLTSFFTEYVERMYSASESHEDRPFESGWGSSTARFDGDYGQIAA